MPEIKLYLLDSPHIEIDHRPAKLQSRKETALLAYLALANKVCRREILTTLLWPDYDVSHGRTNLRQRVFGLNRVLPEGWLVSDQETIGLSPGAGLWVDVVDFQRRLAECAGHGHPVSETCPACQPLLTQAVELYRDDFMSGFSLADSASFDDWQLFQTESLRGELGVALEKLAQCLVQKGGFTAALPHARRWLSLDRLNEAAHCTLMRLYAWAGQRSAALHQYQECVDVLQEQLGIRPQKTTTDLFQAIEHNRAPKPPAEGPGRQGSVIPLAREQQPGVEEPQKVDLSEVLFSGVTTGQATDMLPTSSMDQLNNLPLQLTSFIGREKEIGSIRRLLEAAPARLALRVGEELMTSLPIPLLPLKEGSGYPQGVWLMKLAPLDDPGLVPQAVASVLGVRESPGRNLTDVLCDFLRHKRLMLILDNCEHLVAACAALAQTLLQNSLGLHILATSRERLGVEGEMVYIVPPLSTPTASEIASVSALA